MTRAILSRLLPLVATASLVACAWVALAPAQVGGLVRVVVVEGASMEPELSAGDLAVVRFGGSPEIGDAVLYHDEDLGADVLHRVVDERGGRFVLKGDSNSFLDNARPMRSEVDGKLWFSIPRLGSAVAWGRQPLHLAIAVFVIALLVLARGASRPRGSGTRSATS
jgi:signal peptidase I